MVILYLWMTSLQHFVPEKITFKENKIQMPRISNEKTIEECGNNVIVFAEKDTIDIGK